MDTAKSGIDEVMLPCGYLKGDVLYDIVNIREITGEEEDILASPKVISLSTLFDEAAAA